MKNVIPKNYNLLQKNIKKTLGWFKVACIILVSSKKFLFVLSGYLLQKWLTTVISNSAVIPALPTNSLIIIAMGFASYFFLFVLGLLI